MAKIETAEIGSGQEQVKALTTENAVLSIGTLVKAQEPTVIVGLKDSILGENAEHTVHRVLAAKLVKKGQAKYKNKQDEDKAKEIEAAEAKANK